MTTKLIDINDNDFVIFDAKKLEPYIARSFPNRTVALAEKQILLEGFPENSPWRERLTVRRKQGDIYV